VKKQIKVLLKKAYKEHGKIVICPKCKTWSNSITNYRGKTVLWFNTLDNSTHAIKTK